MAVIAESGRRIFELVGGSKFLSFACAASIALRVNVIWTLDGDVCMRMCDARPANVALLQMKRDTFGCRLRSFCHAEVAVPNVVGACFGSIGVSFGVFLVPLVCHEGLFCLLLGLLVFLFHDFHL